MDAFTQNILSRARERQRLLEDYTDSPNPTATPKSPKITSSSSQPNLTESRKTNRKETSSDSNISKKLKETVSEDNVRLEVQIEEQHSPDNKNDDGTGLRQDAKKRLDRLGKLYGSGDDAEISSPIHRTEAKFCAEDSPEEKSAKPEGSRKGLRKLEDLAESINQWEDDLRIHKTKSAVPKKTWKPPAPQPPATSPVKASIKPKAPAPPKIVAESPKKEEDVTPKQLKWDKKVLANLESQGFTRTASSSRLVYKYDSQDKDVRRPNSPTGKENTITEETEEETASFLPKSPVKTNHPKSPVKTNQRTAAIADKAALFESSPSRSVKDPALLSVSERKALFEKNKGTALMPKAAFAMATPVKSDTPKVKATKKSPAPKPPVVVKKEAENLDVKTPKKLEVKPMVHQAANREVVKPAVAQGRGVASTMAALLEGKSTISQEQIENSVRTERQKEMEMLMNRFKKNNKEVVDEVEEIDDLDDVTEETAMLPQKPATVVPPPPPPPAQITSENRRSSGNKRCGKADSPKVAAVLSDVKRIKIVPKKSGLYPSISDIESTTETENDDNRSPHDSSFEDSIADSDEVNTSFGRDILRTVCKNQTPQKRQILDTSSDMSDLLDGVDDYIDEALAYDEALNGPTPPKIGRHTPTGPEPSNSFNYKSYTPQFKSPHAVAPRKSPDLPEYVVDGDNVLPLTHTVSFYRKQQNQTSTTPIRQISRQPLIEEVPERRSGEHEKVAAKIKELQGEVNKQQMIIAQTSQALNLCNSTPEFMGSTEQVEAERVLLVATHRRQAAVHELQRLEVEDSLRPQGQHSKNVPLEKGTLTISKIVLPLKQKYVTALAAAGGKGHHVVCLIKCGEHVVSTPLVSTVVTNIKNPDMELDIPGVIKLKDIYSDFTVTFEVYCLQAQEEILPHEVKYHINNKKSTNKSTPKKSKQESRLLRPLKESPGGPTIVRSPTFALMGYVVFSVQAVNKRHWSLNNTPPMSPLEGTVEMCISCELAVSVEHRGFLTMFEDVSGFGAWHRRWCLLKSHTLSYWKYPEDERKVPPIDTINLKHCVTKQVGPVSREICARLHTFLLERERVAYPQDKDTLVMVRKGDKTIIRHLLSADVKEERVEWCNKLNAALTALRMWGDKSE